jgi:hypothetical protein
MCWEIQKRMNIIKVVKSQCNIHYTGVLNMLVFSNMVGYLDGSIYYQSFLIFKLCLEANTWTKITQLWVWKIIVKHFLQNSFKYIPNIYQTTRCHTPRTVIILNAGIILFLRPGRSSSDTKQWRFCSAERHWRTRQHCWRQHRRGSVTLDYTHQSHIPSVNH